MSRKTKSDLVESWTFEAIRTLAGAATVGEVESMREALRRQAELCRRNGDDGRAAFWDALAKGIGDAAGRSDQQASGARPTADAV